MTHMKQSLHTMLRKGSGSHYTLYFMTVVRLVHLYKKLTFRFSVR